MLELFILLVVGAMLIGIGVHFIPVGGAPAALSTTAGIPTGAPMITVGMGITGILITATVINNPFLVVLLSGATTSMLVMSIIMLFSNMIHVYGVGVPLSSSTFEKDPITGLNQEEYISPGTTGHGIPTISFISGLIGSFMAGLGGSLLYFIIHAYLITHNLFSSNVGDISAIMTLLIFFIIAVMSSYNIGGTIQGFYDKKFYKKIKSGLLASFIISLLLAVVYVVILGGFIYV